jgi:hypothetical protein
MLIDEGDPVSEIERCASDLGLKGPKLVFGGDYPVATPQETLDGTLAVNRVIQGTGLPPVEVDAPQAAVERDTLELPGISS